MNSIRDPFHGGQLIEVGNIPENVTPLVNYSYLANGAKLSEFDGNGEGLMYRGPFVYRKSSDSDDNTGELYKAVDYSTFGEKKTQ